jgi:hypothetical protein
VKRALFTASAVALAALVIAVLAGGPTHAETASGHAPSRDKVDHRPPPPGPRQDPSVARATDTGHARLPDAAHARGRSRSQQIVDPDPPTPVRGDQEDVETGESRNAASSKYLIYHGGAVQTTPRIYLVFWGSSWTTSAGDPDGVSNRLHYLYQGIGGSSWANVLEQYGGSLGSFTNPGAQYQGWMRDYTPVPANPTQADIEAAVQRAANVERDYSSNAQYVIALPWGVLDQETQRMQACAYHNWKYVYGSTWATYTVLPYMPYMDSDVYNCGGNWVNGTAGLLDGVTIIAGHEYAETVTDPGLNGWFDSDGSENGDKCAWTTLGNRVLANGYAMAMQATWSNTWRAQYGYGCYFS